MFEYLKSVANDEGSDLRLLDFSAAVDQVGEQMPEELKKLIRDRSPQVAEILRAVKPISDLS
jgi:hypothetical protein